MSAANPADWPDLSIIAQKAFTAPESVETTYKLAMDVIQRGIPGDLVECGVYAGAQCAAMAKALMETSWRKEYRRVHLFDSFAGIPKPGPEDQEFMQHGTPAGDAACSLEQVVANMREWHIPNDLLVYHVGWFHDTLKNSIPPQIALLRLDGDLYESTRDCMQMIYPRLSKGGWCIVDDFPLTGCRKAVFEVIIPQPMYFQKL